MWAIRILSGPLKGQNLPLLKNVCTLGRASDNDICLNLPSVSKKHLKIELTEAGIFLIDLGSSNGTFVNGKRIQSHQVMAGDKFSLHDTLFDIITVPNNLMAFPQNQPGHHFQPSNQGGQPPQYQDQAFASSYAQPYAQKSQLAYDPQPHSRAPGAPQMYYHSEEGHPSTQQAPQQSQGLEGFKQVALNYINEVVLPGVYILPQKFEFKWVLGLFVAAFILFVTTLSSIPLMNILKTSVENESQQRALTISKTLALINQQYIHQGASSALTTEFAMREPGVLEAYIINAVDGSIIAPALRIGEFPNIDFIHQARKSGLEKVHQVSSSKIVALVPIKSYNPETGSQNVKAYSVVVYNMGSLAVNNEKTLSLFIQVFFIALVIGLVLYYFLFKLIEYPLININQQMDQSLRNDHAQVHNDYKFTALQNLISNINSSLSRASSPGEDQMDEGFQASPILDRDQELTHLTQLIGFPAMVVRAQDELILSINVALEEKLGVSQSDLYLSAISDLTDQALQLSLNDLIEQSKTYHEPSAPLINQLDFSGINYEINLLPIFGDKEVKYFMFVFLNYGDEE